MRPDKPLSPATVAAPVAPQTFSHYPTWPLPMAAETTVTTRHLCGYLPGKISVFRAFDADALSPHEYQLLMDSGFRRSGTIVYQPMCQGCRSCVPLRVPVARFRPSKSQRRVLRLNADLTVRAAAPEPTAEKWELYDRYQREWHDGQQAGDPIGFINFLYRSPVRTLEFEYRDPSQGNSSEQQRGGKLVGVGICDQANTGLSSVYFFFDPKQSHRSPGTFSALYELMWAQERRLTHWYAGYWVNGCREMEYKSRFQPAEVLGTDGLWREMRGAAAASDAGVSPAE